MVMPVSYKYKCVHIHIPKNAGSSVSKVFRLIDNRDNLHYGKSVLSDDANPLDIIGNKYRGEAFAKGTFISPQHFPASKVRKLIGDDKYNNFFKFAFVRNPWDRMVSEYYYRRRHPSTWKNQLSFAIKNGLAILWKNKKDYEWESFEDFLRLANTKLREEDAMRVTIFDAHFEPQVDFLDDKMDFVGRFENIKNDWKYVCKKIGVEGDKEGMSVRDLPRENASSYEKSKDGVKRTLNSKRARWAETHYSEFYNSNTKSIVESLFREDIDTFGYSFESK